MPGKKRLNLHASYAILDGEKVDRDAYRPEHFGPWIDFAKEEGLDGIDFNPTLFSHPMLVDGLSLSSPTEYGNMSSSHSTLLSCPPKQTCEFSVFLPMCPRARQKKQFFCQIQVS